MTFRIRIFITSAFLCHLFLAPAWLTSQLQPPATAISAAPAADAGEPVTISAREQEKHGDVYKLRGDVEIVFRNYVLRADEITYNSETGQATAKGNVIFDGGPNDEHITASHGTYNVRTESGTFYHVVGSTGARLTGSSVVLTSPNPFMFTGDEVEKVGRNKIIVRHGRVTSCQLPKPKWTFNAGRVEVIAGENAKIYHSTFHLFGLPVFYFPYAQYPVERIPRQSGFLVPHVGRSNRKGLILGEGFYWAINRSMDATLGAEYLSKRGWSQTAEFRARPSENSYINFNYFGVLDRGLPTTETVFVPGVGDVVTPAHQDQGGKEARLTAESPLPFGFRGVATIDYLSQFIFRAAFSERFYEAINSETKSVAFASRSRRGYSFNLMASRYQNFQSVERGDVITIVHAPGTEISSVDRKLGKTPFYGAFNVALEGLSRREPSFVTGDVVGRFDLVPTVSMPLNWKGWSFRPELSLHQTYYSERLLPGGTGLGTPSDQSVNRRALETAVDVRLPALAKIFDKPLFGHKIKHVIEPRFRYRMVSGVNNFENIIRFDERDILSDTNEIEYSLVQRWYSKRSLPRECEEAGVNPSLLPGCETPAAREAVSWEIAQKYFFDPNFGGALVPGRRNVFTTTADFTGIAFLTEPRRFSPIISRLRVTTGSKADADWQIDYDIQKGRISSSTELVSYRFLNQFSFGAGHAFLQTPGEVITSNPTLTAPSKFNQFRLQLNYGSPNRRGMNLGGLVGFDAHEGFVQYSAVQTTYNWDCCGFTFEFRRFYFPFGSIRDERQYRFALTLANIGTFGTLRKQERLF
ncbi:MAG TPA: LPS assembly protein LptD [Terriglobales bacterium]|nr:LPS assembly protein LptD [Terriglobales bacterium]